MRVLITGATSGLGREMALQLARKGAKLALTGRREDRLKEVAAAIGGDVLLLPGSVTELSEVKRHYALIKEKWGGLDWAVLNAGVGDSMSALEFEAEAYRWTYETNVFGVANWLEAVLPDMIAQKSGVVAGVASLAAFRGLPTSGPYCSSKAALMTMLESTRVDLLGTGVDVVTVCPGFVKSEMTDRNDPGDMWFLMEVEDGAKAIIRGIEARKRIVHFPWALSLPVKYGLNNLPGFIYDFAASRMKPRRKKPSRPRA